MSKLLDRLLLGVGVAVFMAHLCSAGLYGEAGQWWSLGPVLGGNGSGGKGDLPLTFGHCFYCLNFCFFQFLELGFPIKLSHPLRNELIPWELSE